MPAVTKATCQRQFLDIAEGTEQVHCVNSQFPHAGRVDDNATARHGKHFTHTCRVASLVVAFSYFCGCLSFAAQQHIYQRGLADAGRTNERRGHAQGDKFADTCATLNIQCRRHKDFSSACDLLNFLKHLIHIFTSHVAFRQQNDRPGATAPGDCQITFQSTGIVVAVQGHADENDVDVRGNYLNARCVASDHSLECRPSSQHFMYHGFACRVRDTA